MVLLVCQLLQNPAVLVNPVEMGGTECREGRDTPVTLDEME